METKINFTRVNNDVNGNPRYVCHFFELITDSEQEQIRATSKPFESVSNMYNFALTRAKQIGGKKFHNKSFGGGIVFQSYNLPTLEKEIKSLLN
jgi:hypothetical protein